MSKCYAYGRHSTAKQGLTRSAQLSKCHNYFRHNLEPEGVEWGGFAYDAAQSAKKPWSEREHGRGMYFGVQPGDHIVVAKYDRAFRSVLDGLQHLKALEDRGVTFHSVRERIDTSTAMGRAFRAVLLIIAEVEREMASERTRDVQESLRLAGKPYCQGCPAGWKIVGGKGSREYRADKDERELCRQFYELQQAGESLVEITKWACTQTRFPAKRGWTFPNKVKWGIWAYRAGFPKHPVSWREFFKAVREGRVSLAG